MVRWETPPQAAAWNEHHAVPTVATESSTRATGSNHGCFEAAPAAFGAGVAEFESCGFMAAMGSPSPATPRRNPWRGWNGWHRRRSRCARGRPGDRMLRMDRRLRAVWRRRDDDIVVVIVMAVIPRIRETDTVVHAPAGAATAAIRALATRERTQCGQKQGAEPGNTFRRFHVSGLLSAVPPAIP